MKRLKVPIALISVIALVAASFIALASVRAMLFRAATPPKPDLTATFLRFEKLNAWCRSDQRQPPVSQEVNCAIIKVTNTGNCTISLYGYGWEAPFYYIYSVSGLHWSYDYSLRFDYEKVRPIKLQPGRSMLFAALTPIPKHWMVGVPYCEATADEILPRRAWRALSRLNPPRKQQHIAWTNPLITQQ